MCSHPRLMPVHSPTLPLSQPCLKCDTGGVPLRAGAPPPSLQTRETEAPLLRRGDASPPLPRWRRFCSDATTWQRRDTLSLAANARRRGVHLDSTAPTCGRCANPSPSPQTRVIFLFRREDVATRAAKPSPVTKSVRQSSPTICYHRLYSLFPFPGVKFWEVVSDLNEIERDGLYKGNNDEPALVSTACDFCFCLHPSPTI
jgi:hypothetical protein